MLQKELQKQSKLNANQQVIVEEYFEKWPKVDLGSAIQMTLIDQVSLPQFNN